MRGEKGGGGNKVTMKGDIKIIYEDRNLLVLDKPSGLAVHEDGRTSGHTLADWLVEKYPEIRDVGEPMRLQNGEVILRPGIVHRLDRETSGVMVVAKNQETFLALKKEFQERRVKKTYRAFVYGIMKNDGGIIDKPIGRSRSDLTKWSAEYGAKGRASKSGGELREAVTEYKVLARDEKAGATYLEVYPKTGRTHQIRVHLKAIGHPVLCDKVYAPQKPCILNFSRLALHAFAIEFTLPGAGVMRLEAEMPEEFERAWEHFLA
ncbi:RluA family pseudouridine synthase [bacterium]|nr:RluA family pseudouridine synthase [bacterium]